MTGQCASSAQQYAHRYATLQRPPAGPPAVMCLSAPGVVRPLASGPDMSPRFPCEPALPEPHSCASGQRAQLRFRATASLPRTTAGRAENLGEPAAAVTPLVAPGRTSRMQSAPIALPGTERALSPSGAQLGRLQWPSSNHDGAGRVAATSPGHHGGPAKPNPHSVHRQQASLCDLMRNQLLDCCHMLRVEPKCLESHSFPEAVLYFLHRANRCFRLGPRIWSDAP